MPLGPVYDFLEGVKPIFLDDDLIITFDMEILEVFTPETLEGLTSLMIGGGSNTKCILDFKINQNINPLNIIVLTDGYLYDSDDSVWVPNAIYLITPNGTDSVIDHGQMIHMHGDWIVPLAMCMN